MAEEERKFWAKELSIARQSSIKLSLELCKVHGIAPSVKELIRLTDFFAEDALLAPNQEFKDNMVKIDEWIKKKKEKKSILKMII